jgi:protein SPT2
VANEIWNILGRDRSAYVSRDVFSDDEDMEADASILEREEKLRFGYRYLSLVFKIGLPFFFSFSARLAQQEDTLALEEERRREEEKRRRKKEAMMRERRN